MNEFQRTALSENGADEGYTTSYAGPQHGEFGAFQPGRGIPMGYDDLRVIEARNLLAAVRDGVQHAPGLKEMAATGQVLAALQRSSDSHAWEKAQTAVTESAR